MGKLSRNLTLPISLWHPFDMVNSLKLKRPKHENTLLKADPILKNKDNQKSKMLLPFENMLRKYEGEALNLN